MKRHIQRLHDAQRRTAWAWVRALVLVLAAAAPVAATVPVAAPPPAGPVPAAGTLSAFAGRTPGLADAAIGVSPAAAPAPRRVPLRQTILATIAEPGFREIILVGLATIFVAAFARRRRRRRIGWGVLPARPSQR